MEPQTSYIEYLCIFNPDIETREEALHDQILFYYDSLGTTTDEQQVRDIGLLQGLTAFSEEFCTGKSVSSIEAEDSRTVVKLVERENWWIGLRIKYGPGETGKNVAPPALLIANILKGYRQWRLHNGTFSMTMETMSREVLVQNLATFWTAFAEKFPMFVCDLGALDLFLVDNLRLARGSLTSGTVKALETVLDRDPEVLHIVVCHESHEGHDILPGSSLTETRDGDTSGAKSDIGDQKTETTRQTDEPNEHASVHNESVASEPVDQTPLGASSARSIRYSSPSVSEDVRESDSTRTHQEKRTTRRTKRSTTNSESEGPGPGCVWHGGSVQETSVCDLYNWIAQCQLSGNDESFEDRSGICMPLAPRNIPNTDNVADKSFLSSFAKYVPSMDQMKQVTSSYFGLKLSNGNGVNIPVEAKIEDIVNSRFLVGLKGELEDDTVTEEITMKSIYVHLDQETQSAETFVKCRLVIYRRRPYILGLVYRQDSQCLGDDEYYRHLHRRLASLSEPISADLHNSLCQQREQIFQYVVADFSHRVVQSNFPLIPPMLTTFEVEQMDASHAEKRLKERYHYVLFHMLVNSLLELPIPETEQERILRTDKNWWVYVCKLPEQRVAILAQRYTGSNRERTNSLGNLSKEAKDWLADYMSRGRV